MSLKAKSTTQMYSFNYKFIVLFETNQILKYTLCMQGSIYFHTPFRYSRSGSKADIPSRGDTKASRYSRTDSKTPAQYHSRDSFEEPPKLRSEAASEASKLARSESEASREAAKLARSESEAAKLARTDSEASREAVKLTRTESEAAREAAKLTRTESEAARYHSRDSFEIKRDIS